MTNFSSPTPKLYSHQDKLKMTYCTEEIKRIKSNVAKQEKQIQDLKETVTSLTEKIQEAERSIPPSITHEASQLSAGCSSFFSYSILIPKTNEEDPITIIGSYTITNTGTAALHEPVICLEISPSAACNLTGKINYRPVSQTEQYIISDDYLTWEFTEGSSLQEARKSGLYWLKPASNVQLEINQSLSFSPLELQISKKHVEDEITVRGYVICREIPEGQAAINSISCKLS
ncbi:hypothetical protein PQ478_15545 [Alkalihalophilus pseudofirmus]|uniref:hypothetical protein n=1 Tax=Alkalihalophilus pseudofirmus TaxID=79885 RepID=UPI00259B6B94|nr:hypothetical protein [Alkalihalophilus pseudofirmus]WEG15918.1 hypothetical protein PQ478_15545 [Alkalihalophilus pseudofirmus]